MKSFSTTTTDLGVKSADILHKFVGYSLIAFTVVGTLNLVSAFDFKLRRNRKAQRLLEEATVKVTESI